nr:PREDICTED: zona pellucida-like domain-containing protein 1 [Latimeria chalumnae]|eukprot:XP_014339369.1 PREDICTED: zona pellucida-like domain-containing protein 1 [Latimeria chalumnae]
MDRFNVLLDRCYASTSSFPTNSTYYDLFVGCYKDQQTTLILNGDDQIARFSFEAFRFTEHKNLHVSTFYLHCITRLCDKSSCNNFKPSCKRKREVREVATTPASSTISDSATVTSVGIDTKNDNVNSKDEPDEMTSSKEEMEVSVGLGITIGFLILLCILTGFFAFFLYKRFQGMPILKKI